MTRQHKAPLRPGQVEPTELEAAILARLIAADPAIAPHCEALHVLSREFTGVGSFTTFRGTDEAAERSSASLDALIVVPGVSGGLGAVLFCLGNRPDVLEIFTYGDERWDGRHDGFRIEDAGA
ncbi:MAG: hypothetical protein AAF682_14750 [Planctomycetota bacterium]